jgi:hypothetical protein
MTIFEKWVDPRRISKPTTESPPDNGSQRGPPRNGSADTGQVLASGPLTTPSIPSGGRSAYGDDVFVSPTPNEPDSRVGATV